MAKKINIGSKITALVVAVALVSVLVVSLIAYQLHKKSDEERYFEAVNLITDTRVQELDIFFKQLRSSMKLTQDLPIMEQSITTLAAGNDSAATVDEGELDEVLNSLSQNVTSTNVYLTNTEGQVVYKANKVAGQEVGDVFGDKIGNLIAASKDSLSFATIKEADGTLILFAAAPLVNASEELAGRIICEINIKKAFAFVADTNGLGATGEVVLVTSIQGSPVYLNNLRNSAGIDKARPIVTSESIKEVLKGNRGSATDKDYRNKLTLAAWKPVPMVNWGLVSKIDTSEVYQPATDLRNKFLLIGFLILAGSLAIGFIFSHLLISPFLSLKELVGLLGNGVLPEKLEKRSNDEIGEMTDTVNSLVEGLRKTANFAHKIGEGNFDADFKPMSNDDTLGLALLNMRDSIQASAKRDDEQNWIVTGVAEIGDILRSNNSLEELSEKVIAYLTNKIGAIQGAFYVVNDEDEGNHLIEMKASFAYNKKKYLKSKFKFAEGLVGQAAIEQDTIMRTEIPNSYMTITSGLLGEKKPKCILIVPLITIIGSEKMVYGVMEFAGFEKFSSRNVRYINEVSEIIARTVFNIKVNETTRQLLEMSQKQSEELQVQQEVLRQNAEEMQATQEELKRTNHALEDKIEQVNHVQKRMQALLENASEVITIYEADRKIRYISPSVTKILGYAQDEMIGIDDSIYVHEAGRESIAKMFSDLIENPSEQVTIQFSYLRKNGDEVWLEATGTNLLTDPAIEGIIINSRDITERRRAQQEERMRGQMQALSENSLDLITRFNHEGRIFYINPVIEAYTGHKKEDFYQRTIGELSLEPMVVDSWTNILRDVLITQDKVAAEMEFPSVDGNRVMQVNAIPEYNEQNDIESVLVVSHDITERKMTELEIQSKNKKITESINYARRIQGAILPNNEIIKAVFPDAFILYKPRDVVSGDFPWFMQKGDDLYIAAVDCTGHGVPGALISLIGYFLLNNIVSNQDSLEIGEILDMLDEGVTRTLKQDSQDSSSRDGMDISFCKVNLINGTLQYAGAHRPLYFVHNGELTEIKGDKFPIGGGQYKDRTKFVTTTLQIVPGDSVFFCSDGFPDQFGGPDNRKFSPKKIREIILTDPTRTMDQVHHHFDEEFETWKANGKQTDDVLMIGIKF
jgi:PAS domain S-box-containing protein